MGFFLLFLFFLADNHFCFGDFFFVFGSFYRVFFTFFSSTISRVWGLRGQRLGDHGKAELGVPCFFSQCSGFCPIFFVSAAGFTGQKENLDRKYLNYFFFLKQYVRDYLQKKQIHKLKKCLILYSQFLKKKVFYCVKQTILQ